MHQKYFSIYLLTLLMLINIRCSTLKNMIHIPYFYQGSYLSIYNIKKINKGMTKQEIINILGIPTIKNYFNVDLWYYILITKIHNHSQLQSTLTLYFKKNTLVKINYLVHNS